MTVKTYTVRIRQRGQLTLPQSVREQWAAQNGDVMTLVQFDEFAVLAPKMLKTPSLSGQFSQMMDEEGLSLADLLEGLAEERVRSYELAHTRED